MEFLSGRQLQQYEDIIDLINIEFEKHDSLKKQLEEENNKVVVSHLVNSKLSEKVSHVNVKIFNEATDLFILYSGELESDFHKYIKYDDCKFYLLEIYISKPLMQKIKGLNWLLHISITTDTVCINKILNVPQKSPILEVIPVDENVIDCEINTSLVLPSNDKWMVIKLDKKKVDISYHFQNYKEKRKVDFKNKSILQIAKCHNETLDIQELRKPVTLEYKLICDVEKSNFIQALLRNSYHKLDVELFSQLGNEADFILQFSSGSERHKLIYNKDDKVLTLKSNVSDLCMLKKYFFKEFHCSNPTDRASLAKIKLKDNLPENAEESTNFYKEVRKTWLQLPV